MFGVVSELFDGGAERFGGVFEACGVVCALFGGGGAVVGGAAVFSSGGVVLFGCV